MIKDPKKPKYTRISGGSYLLIEGFCRSDFYLGIFNYDWGAQRDCKRIRFDGVGSRICTEAEKDDKRP